jgi:hypothetical protein
MRKYLLAFITISLLFHDLAGQEWVVPEDKRGKLSTFAFDDNSRKAGEALYMKNCMSCHGTPGKGNFLNLVPPPGDPATNKIQHNSDGEIFYKVTTGRGSMPSFKSVFTSTDIWNIISFLRSFNPSYKQLIMPVITSSAYPGAVIRLVLSYNPADSTIVLESTAVKENSKVPVTGAEVKLLVKRTFGMLPVDEVKTTDRSGIAAFRIPASLPGDTAGNIKVSARFVNEDLFGSVSKDTILQAASKTFPVSLVAQRAMWNNVRKAPVWILLTFTLGVLVAWGFIIYVMLMLRDIFIVGRYISKKETDKIP